MTSVVIAAHNEGAVLRRCLESVRDAREVVVVANGCRDDTAAVARAWGATVIELPNPGKAAALNTGDRVATSFPRIYMDADVVLGPGGLAAIARALDDSGALAAMPRREMDLAGRPAAVRAYYAIHSRLPAVRQGLYGRGLIALSAEGRARFDEFPNETADDLFLDSLFREDEKVLVDSVAVRVAAPMRTRDLYRRLVRVRAGNAAMRARSPNVRRARRLSWLTDVVLRAPWLAPAAVCYVGITVAAALGARRARATGTISWAHDQSTRTSS